MQDRIDSEKSSNFQNSIQQNNSSTSKQQDPLPLNPIDIGNLLEGLKYIDDENRFCILTNDFQPDASFEFPSTFKHGCNRSLNLKWLNKYQFLSYSKALRCCFLYPMHFIYKSMQKQSQRIHNWFFKKIGTKLMKKQMVITYLRIM